MARNLKWITVLHCEYIHVALTAKIRRNYTKDLYNKLVRSEGCAQMNICRLQKWLVAIWQEVWLS